MATATRWAHPPMEVTRTVRETVQQPDTIHLNLGVEEAQTLVILSYFIGGPANESRRGDIAAIANALREAGVTPTLEEARTQVAPNPYRRIDFVNKYAMSPAKETAPSTNQAAQIITSKGTPCGISGPWQAETAVQAATRTRFQGWSRRLNVCNGTQYQVHN